MEPDSSAPNNQPGEQPDTQNNAEPPAQVPSSPPAAVVSSPPIEPAAPSEPAIPAGNASAAAVADYVSNPFLITVRGLILMLKVNPVSTLLSGLAGLCLLFGLYVLSLIGVTITGSAALGIIVGIFAVFASLIPFGAYLVIGSRSAREETVTTTEALGTATQKLIILIALGFMCIGVVFLGLLLFIIPGIYLLGRLSLSGLIIFEEGVGALEAMKRSFALTQGHVVEVLASSIASAAIFGGGYGLLFGASTVAPIVGRYHDLKALKQSGAAKPPVHWLNYLLLALPVILIVGFGILTATVLHSAKSTIDQNPYDTVQPTTFPSNDNFYNQ